MSLMRLHNKISSGSRHRLSPNCVRFLISAVNCTDPASTHGFVGGLGRGEHGWLRAGNVINKLPPVMGSTTTPTRSTRTILVTVPVTGLTDKDRGPYRRERETSVLRSDR